MKCLRKLDGENVYSMVSSHILDIEKVHSMMCL